MEIQGQHLPCSGYGQFSYTNGSVNIHRINITTIPGFLPFNLLSPSPTTIVVSIVILVIIVVLILGIAVIIVVCVLVRAPAWSFGWLLVSVGCLVLALCGWGLLSLGSCAWCHEEGGGGGCLVVVFVVKWWWWWSPLSSSGGGGHR